ncbi:MAG TPA: hypothetical protein VN181_16060 [Thermoanaerobaculia bacterium]|nr:hypothetical protein [Thermoanaerobaculia bacterium]
MAILLLLLACEPDVRDEIQRIAVDGRHSLEEKMRIVESLNTPERTDRVRAAVKKQFPELTDRDLASLYLGYESDFRAPPSTREVVFIVGMGYREGLNRRRIVKYALGIVSPEVEAAIAAAPHSPPSGRPAR